MPGGDLDDKVQTINAKIDGCTAAATKALVRKGKLPDRGTVFLGMGGDGATSDIGLQALSGAFERGHRFVYVCYDNGAYMNTGIQRSSATPLGADTTTCPAGSAVQGKPQGRKDLAKIIAAHQGTYVAQASPSSFCGRRVTYSVGTP